jgi:hypothetical protein
LYVLVDQRSSRCSSAINRRHFDAALDLVIARARRRGPTANLAAIMFD